MVAANLVELVRYRGLLGMLAWRDIRVRYKQSLLGVAWVFLQPLLAAGAFTLIFRRVAGLPSPEGVPYCSGAMYSSVPTSSRSGVPSP